MRSRNLALLLIASPAFAAITWTGVGQPTPTPLSSPPAPENRPVVYTISASGDATELQTAYNDACLGDTIKITPGTFSYTTGEDTEFAYKSCGSGRITITTTEEAKLPATGSRITPAYLPLMPIFQRTTGDNVPMFAFRGAVGHPGVEHITVRGIAFRPTPGSNFDNGTGGSNGSLLNFGYILIGHAETYGTSGCDRTLETCKVSTVSNFRSASVSVDAGAGATTITVSDPTGFDIGDRFYVNTSDQWMYVISGVSGNDITFTRWYASSGTGLHDAMTTGNAVYLLTADKPTTMDHEPDDIIIQHCVLINPEALYVSRLIMNYGRAVTIRDSYLEGPNDVGPNDSQTITIGEVGVGPHTIENNAIIGGSENIMFGGNPPAHDTQAESATIRYNWLAHYPERDRMWGHWCMLFNGCTATEGAEKVGRDYGMSSVLADSRIVFRGAQVSTNNTATGPWFQAMRTGIVSATNNSIAAAAVQPNSGVYTLPDFSLVALKGTFTSGGVELRKMSANNKRHMIKNNFEIKSAQNVLLQYNYLDWFPLDGAFSTSQHSIANIKATNQTSCSLPWPQCPQPRTRYITISRNKIRTAGGGIALQGTTDADVVAGNIGDYTVDGNLLIQAEPVTWPGGAAELVKYCYINLFAADAAAGTSRGDTPNVLIRNNTFYDPFPHLNYAIGTEHQGTGLSWWSGAEFKGNIMQRGGGTLKQYVAGNDTQGALSVFPCNGTSSGGCAGFAKNIIVGAPTSASTSSSAAFPISGTSKVVSNCSTTSLCVSGSSSSSTVSAAWDYDYDPSGVLDAGKGVLFRNRTAGDFRVRNEHVFAKRSMPDGSDIGADTAQVPDIRGLKVTPTDRMVLFQWSVTAPIADIPCAVEVHTSPDFANDFYYDPDNAANKVDAAYVGELSNISTYYNQVHDSADRNVRRGLNRMHVVGHSVALTASTRYFYRIQCGGAAVRGTFTTLADLGEATTTLTTGQSGASAMTWDTTYSRTDDEAGSLAFGQSGTCSGGTSCSATVPRGSVVYYRVADGPVRVAAIQ